MGKLLTLKNYANKQLISVRNMASHTAAIWRVKNLIKIPFLCLNGI